MHTASKHKSDTRAFALRRMQQPTARPSRAMPLVRRSDGRLYEDRSVAPSLTPLRLLGCKAEVRQVRRGSAYSGDAFEIMRTLPMRGGLPLRTLVLRESMFDAAAMAAGGELALAQMKRTQLVAELAAHGSTRTGLKAVLQRRLHRLLVEAALESRQRRKEAEGEEAGEGPRRGVCGRGCCRGGGLSQPSDLTE
jgi:hypothetical protein